MSKLDVVKFLLAEIEEEMELFREYLKFMKTCRENNYSGYSSWTKRVPTKSLTIQNWEKIRELSVEMGKEVRGQCVI